MQRHFKKKSWSTITLYETIFSHVVVGSWLILLNENETHLVEQETNSSRIKAKLAPVNGNFMDFDELFNRRWQW